MTAELTFLRHAHTVWNGPPKRFQGRADVPLSDKGIKQCQALQGEFKWVKRIVASPALRVRQTLETLFENAPNSPSITYDENLWEIDNCDYSGKLIEEVKLQYPENFNTWMTRPGEVRPGNGETLLDLLTRAILSLRSLKQHPLEGTLVATHGGIIRVLMLATQNRSLNEFHELTVENLHRFTLNMTQIETLNFSDTSL